MTVRRELAERAAIFLNPAAATPSASKAETRFIARPLSEWLTDPALLQPPVTVIPHLCIEGRVSLLSGREKIGKSTLIGGAVSAATRGQPVLGVPVDGCLTVLHYNNDEPRGDTARRYTALGADPDRVIFSDGPQSVPDLLEALTAHVDEFAPKVVVVDNLSRAFAMSGIDPNSSREVEPALAGLVEFFHQQKIGGILLYHTNKHRNDYRGSTAIGATVDDVLTLRRPGQPDRDDFDDDAPDDGRRLLIQEGRNLRGKVHLTYKNGVYGLYDDSHPPREKIFEALKMHGSITGRSELVKIAGVRKTSGLKLISKLIDEGTIMDAEGRLTLAASVGSDEFPEGGTSVGTVMGTGSYMYGAHSAETGTDVQGSEPVSLTPEEEADFFASDQWG